MDPAEFLEWLVAKKADGYENIVIDELVAKFVEDGMLTKGYKPYQKPE